MKKGISILALAALFTGNMDARQAMSGNVGGLPVEDATLKRNGDLMTVDMDLNLQDLKVKGDKAVVFTPVIINGNDSVVLESVGLYSRNRWYQYQREGYLNPEDRNEGVAMRYSDRPEVYDYTQSVAYADWMNGASLKLNCDVYSCCHERVEHEDITLAGWTEFIPQPILNYSFEVASAVKVDSLQGRAFVDFPVNKIVIYPDYRNNAYELGKIVATIDSVRNDPDITITSIFIKGTASPEGPYDNNVYLAKNRTIALKDYVMKLYNFAPDFIQTDYNPVDWPGLIDYLKTSHLEHAKEIMAIAESDIEPYARNQKIMKTYPEEYNFLWKTIYPALRHSDYTIRYTIRSYTTVEEIQEVMRTNPKRLGLDEIYVLAAAYEQNSPEYLDVMETAARLYPKNVQANINAANAAMARGDYVLAAQYLDKAGNDAGALYAKANLLMLKGEYQQAADIFRSLSPSMPAAQESLQILIDQGMINE